MNSIFQIFAVVTKHSTRFLHHKDDVEGPSTLTPDDTEIIPVFESTGASTSLAGRPVDESTTHATDIGGEEGSVSVEKSNIDIQKHIEIINIEELDTGTSSIELIESEDVGNESSISIHSLESRVFDRLVQQLEKKPALDSDEAMNRVICRICYGSDEKNLFRVCHCKGSIGHVHVECIERWLQECGLDNCDLCKYKFITVRKPTQSKWRSLLTWFKHADNHEDMVEMMTDFAATFLFCPFIVLLSISGYQAIMHTNAIRFYVPDERITVSLTGAISAAALGTMVLLVNATGLSWVCYITHKHYQRWYAWYRRTTVVKIILPDRVRVKPGTAEETS